MKKSIFVIILFIINIIYINAQILNPVKWSWKAEKIDENTYNLIFNAKMDKHWSLYSQFINGEEGPIPTTFNYDKNSNYQLLGKTTESNNVEEIHDDVFDMKIKKFHDYAIFTQKIKIKDTSKPITGYLNFMTCDDTHCLPPSDVDFSFDLSKLGGKNNTGAIIESPSKKKVDGLKSNASNNRASGTTGSNIQTLDTNASSSTLNQTETHRIDSLGATASGNPISKYKIDKQYIEQECGYDTTVPQAKFKSWWLIFLAGFVGGLLAFLTPCVFPMVPLTVSYFTKKSGTRSQGIRNATYYGLSIIAIYLVLGLIITSLFGADALNQLSTNAWFNIVFAILFIIFGISFFGFFEITLPSSWANKTDSMAGKGGLLGIFFMAFTLALVSFSCTGPIIGTLLVETATGEGPKILGKIPAGPLFGMFGFSLALALPFALFALFPAWLNSLPKSGSWMNTIKVTLGFVEIALALKFISIADLTMGWKIMPYELFVGLWVLLSLGLALYYFGILKFKMDPPKQSVGITRKILGVFSLILAFYFASGFRTSNISETFITPNLLSGLAPPPGHSYILPKECPLNFNCFHDYDKGLSYAKSINKPILLDFTGYGCVNCRRMEDNVWSKDVISKIINDDFVLISLYVDERKELEDKYVSTFSNRQIKTVGQKWGDMQAIHFNTNSQPYYVLLSPDEVVLNKPTAYTPDVEQYRQFLICGVNKNKELGAKK